MGETIPVIYPELDPINRWPISQVALHIPPAQLRADIHLECAIFNRVDHGRERSIEARIDHLLN